MRLRSWLFVATVAAVGAALALSQGCSSSSGTPAGTGGGGGTAGGGSSAGGGGGAAGAGAGGGGGSSGGIECLGGGDGGLPTTPCSSGSCCTDPDAGAATCSSSCPAAQQVACVRVSDCAGGANADAGDCCGTLVLTGTAAPPKCQVVSFSTVCGACTSQLDVTSCQATDHLHICTVASDCASDTSDPKCCSLNSALPNACVPAIVAQLGNLTCLN